MFILKSGITCMFAHKLWIQERLPLASCKDYGTNLQSVQHYLKKNQVRSMDFIFLWSGDLTVLVPGTYSISFFYLADTPTRTDREASSDWGSFRSCWNYCLTENSWGGLCAWRGGECAPAVGGLAAGDRKKICDAGCCSTGSAVLQWGS